MSTSRSRALARSGPAAAVAMLLFCAGIAAGQAPDAHRDGFTVYARVDRPDGTFRNMLVDNNSLAALRLGRPENGTVILMESFSDGRLTSVFTKTRQDGGWSYGSIRPGETLADIRAGPSCSTCHRLAAGTGGSFTQPMLDRFAETSTLQTVFCDRGGRSPCGPEIYERSSGAPE